MFKVKTGRASKPDRSRVPSIWTRLARTRKGCEP